MFNKQKLRFTLLNTMVFVILFIVFSLVIYFYTKSTLYSGVDRNILMAKNVIENRLPEIKSDPFETKPPTAMELQPQPKHIIPSLDPRIIPIIRDEKGNVLFETQLSTFYKSNMEKVNPIKINEIYNISFNEFHFRTIVFPLKVGDKTYMMQLLRNINSEIELLDRLLEIIAIGGISIFLVSIVAGIFLAEKTMVPIVNAWKKQIQFVADASHELRTPLTVIQSQIQLILKSPNSTVISNANHLGTALSETRRLSKLVSDLLTLARSDSDIIEIDKNPTNISSLIKSISEPYIEIGVSDNKDIELNLTENLIINCDKERISQLIVILLDNALKYTNNGDKITVTLIRYNNKCVITVADTGIGINEKQRELIFERFYRGDKSRNRKTGGAGLGLSISKWIVEKHNGNIKADTNHPNGTIIEVVLPIN